jgi:hypothetical protein
MIDADDARLGRALEGLERALLGVERLGTVYDYSDYALQLALMLASVLGREAALADVLAERFVLGEPSRLQAATPNALISSIPICLWASREVGRRCVARLQTVVSEQGVPLAYDFLGSYLSGASALMAGDRAAAAEGFRKTYAMFPFVPPGVMRELGLEDVLATADRTELGQGRRGFGGVTLAHVREATRQADAGNTARARELAEAVVAAWGHADVAIPAVAEMRALLPRLPTAP